MKTQKKSRKRVFHHCDDLEESPMWGTSSGEDAERQIEQSADIMRDEGRFRAAMERALAEWPYSSEHNLTARNSNRRAWLGHAGCFIAVGSREACTRRGWHELTEEEKTAADRVAQEVIDAWEESRA